MTHVYVVELNDYEYQKNLFIGTSEEEAEKFCNRDHFKTYEENPEYTSKDYKQWTDRLSSKILSWRRVPLNEKLK